MTEATLPRPARRPRSPATLWAFLRRDLQVVRTYRTAWVMDAGSTIMQVALFFYLSRIVDAGGMSALQSGDSGYFAFVIVGIVMIRIVEAAMSTFADTLESEQAGGTFEALLTTPAPLRAIMLGAGTYSLLYGTVTGLLIFVVSLGLGVDLNMTPVSGALAFASFLAAMAFFAALGIAVAAFIVVFKQGGALIGLMSQALGLLGGVYFPVTIFPRPLQLLAEWFPFTWALDAIRAGALEAQPLWGDVARLVIVAAVSLPASLWALRRAIDRARAGGTLTQY